jgi:hypothetical protein
MFILCVLYSKDNQEKETSMDKVQTENKRIKETNPAEGMDFVSCICCVFCR